jgi:GeoRSP system SPASM domain protein
MNLKELASPIRMYWDIGPTGNALVPDHGRIAGEITANKVLSLQITESAPTLSQACLTILETLRNKAIALSLVAPLTALDAPSLGILRGLPQAGMLLISTRSRGEIEAAAEVARRAREKPAAGIAFSVTRENFLELPGVLASCIKHGVANLVLPMQRLTGHEECFSFTREERQELTGQLKRIDKPAWLKIIIHDPFLWRAFFPSIGFPDGGCQAANTMLYISPDASVYPCPTLPVKIGNLLHTSLKDVTCSDRKKELRKSLLTAPSDCRDCEALNQCKGGCRGRAYKIKHSLYEPDPACR